MARSRSHTRRPPRANPCGVLNVRGAGFGFVQTAEGEFFVPSSKMGGAFDGDVVEAVSYTHLDVYKRQGLQIDGRTSEVCDPGDLGAKFAAFGWDVRTVDGHDLEALVDVLSACKAERAGRPHALIAHTVKGKGVSFMEDQAGWHGKAPNAEQLEAALAELVDACEKEACRD